MNKYFLYIGLFISGCDILDAPPLDSIPSEDAIVDVRGLQAAVNGVYDGLQRGAIVLDYSVMADLAADNLEAVGSKIDYITIDNHDVFANNIYTTAVWNAHYDVINRANSILVNLDNVNGITESLQNQTEAEMKFIRAYSYFNLVRMFGGVPLRMVPPQGASSSDVNIGRSTLEQTYAFINEDLDRAEVLLLGAGSGTAVKVNEAVVLAMKARVKLYEKDWQLATDYAQRVIDDFSYQLEPNYADIFNESVPSPEIIFQIDFFNDNDVNTIADWLLASGRYEAAATQNLFNTYENADLRKASTIGLSSGKYFCNKYTDSQNDKDNFIAFRLAEMHLIAAEALNEQNYIADGEAFDHLNAIRTRAGLSVLEEGDLVNQQAFRNIVELERRRELAFEGHRWFDLIRTNRAQTLLEITNSNKLLMPIPQSELDANKHPDMKQNQDY